MYDPSVGRWLEEDPEDFAAGDVNLYRYAKNDPVLLSDPSGAAPPTADTLRWRDFKTVKVSLQPPHDATTVWNYNYRYTVEAEVRWTRVRIFPVEWEFHWNWCLSPGLKRTKRPSDIRAGASAAIKFEKNPQAIFDLSRSWVVEGKKSQFLLDHETLHLKMAEYIADRARVQGLKVRGAGQSEYHSDTAQGEKDAKTEATNNAKLDAKKKMDSVIAKWELIDKVVQTTYDAEVKDQMLRPIEAAQRDWQMNWPKKVDKILAANGW